MADGPKKWWQEGYCPRWWQLGAPTTTAIWLVALLVSLVRHNPWFIAWSAWAFGGNETVLMSRWLRKGETHAPRDDTKWSDITPYVQRCSVTRGRHG